jgi:hypothetical protein
LTAELLTDPEGLAFRLAIANSASYVWRVLGESQDVRAMISRCPAEDLLTSLRAVDLTAPSDPIVVAAYVKLAALLLGGRVPPESLAKVPTVERLRWGPDLIQQARARADRLSSTSTSESTVPAVEVYPVASRVAGGATSALKLFEKEQK